VSEEATPIVVVDDGADGRVCPAPGGCRSCPDPLRCCALRVTLGLTTVVDEARVS
jgi:hypothetical protein